jgi:hypothetical protein
VESRIEPPQFKIVGPDPSHSPVNIVSIPRTIEMYCVSERELDQIETASGSRSINLVFFGITFGAALAFLISVLTVEFNNRVLVFVWALFVLTLTTIYFGVQALRSNRSARGGVSTIKNESRRLPR